MKAQKTYNIPVITSIGKVNLIIPSYLYIHYLSDSGLPLSRLVKNDSMLRNRARVVVKKPHTLLWDFIRALVLFLFIFGIIILIGANFDTRIL